MKNILEKYYLNEGGYVFKTDISAVPKRHLQSTLNRSLKDSGMANVTSHLVGNVSKLYLGDVDVAIDWDDLVKLFGSTGEKKDFWAKADKFMKKQKVESYTLNKGLQQIHVLSPLVDKKGKHLAGVDKDGKEIGPKGMVQIDLMIGNANFMKDSLKGAEGSKYKATWRNMLLADILSNTITGDDQSEIKHKFQINWKTGLQYVRFKLNGKSKKKLNTKTVLTNMDDVAEYIFGPKYKFKDIETFEKIWKAFNSSSFKWKNKRKEIIKSYTQTLDRMKMELPSELNESYTPRTYNMNTHEIQKAVAEVVLENLQNKDSKLAKLMHARERRADKCVTENVNEFIDETINILMEHLHIEKEEVISNIDKEYEHMRRLI